MSKHIPGPLAVEQVVSDDELDIVLGYEIPDAGRPVLIATVFGEEDHGDFTDRECRETAKRLVACYNACEGIEDLSVIAGLRTGRLREELVFLRGLSDDVVESYEKFERHLKDRIEGAEFGTDRYCDLMATLEAFREFFLKQDPRVPPTSSGGKGNVVP